MELSFEMPAHASTSAGGEAQARLRVILQRLGYALDLLGPALTGAQGLRGLLDQQPGGEQHGRGGGARGEK